MGLLDKQIYQEFITSDLNVLNFHLSTQNQHTIYSENLVSANFFFSNYLPFSLSKILSDFKKSYVKRKNLEQKVVDLTRVFFGSQCALCCTAMLMLCVVRPSNRRCLNPFCQCDLLDFISCEERTHNMRAIDPGSGTIYYTT